MGAALGGGPWNRNCTPAPGSDFRALRAASLPRDLSGNGHRAGDREARGRTDGWEGRGRVRAWSREPVLHRSTQGLKAERGRMKGLQALGYREASFHRWNRLDSFAMRWPP